MDVGVAEEMRVLRRGVWVGGKGRGYRAAMRGAERGRGAEKGERGEGGEGGEVGTGTGGVGRDPGDEGA